MPGLFFRDIGGIMANVELRISVDKSARKCALYDNVQPGYNLFVARLSSS